MKVAVIGDFILDNYVIGHSTRISPEAPVPIMQISKTFQRNGGCYNVANNMRIPFELIKDNRDDIIKTRYICNNQQILRIDEENSNSSQVIIPCFIDSLIISDYNKGSIVDFDYIKSKSKNQYIDIKKDMSFYKGATLLKCNEQEYYKFCQFELSHMGLMQALDYYDIGTIVVTRSEKSIIYASVSEYGEVEPPKVEVCDVTGAGDVFLAILCSRLILGDSLKSSIIIATKAASISCQYLGTHTLTEEEYESCIY